MTGHAEIGLAERPRELLTGPLGPFDPASYVKSVTALGFDPHIAVLPDGTLTMRETTPWPISDTIRAECAPWHRALLDTPGAHEALTLYLARTLRIKAGDLLS